MNTYHEAITLLGFTVAQTGGGCTALEAWPSDNTFLSITVEGDPMAPTSLDEGPVVLWREDYPERGKPDVWETNTSFPTLRDCLVSLCPILPLPACLRVDA